MNVLVLDLTHGGGLIAQSLTETDTVTAVDVYRTTDDRARRNFESCGIPVLREPPSAGDFDLIISPVHLDSAYPTLSDARAAEIPVITHHAAVSRILRTQLNGCTVIEVTGTTAKTSTARILAGMLSACTDRRIISHTSAGVEVRGCGEAGAEARVIAKFSIAPASIIAVLRSIEAELGSGSEQRPNQDVLIFEVSLGGTGLADIGIVTTLSGDYLIANNTGTASEAKMQMINLAKPGSTLIIGSDVPSNSDRRTFTFGDPGDVCFERIDAERAVIRAMGKKIEFGVNDYDIFSYQTAILSAVTAAISIGVDCGCIESFLNGFSGVSGRMRVLQVNRRTIVDNSNSGMTIASAESAIEHARRIAGDSGAAKVVLIIGIEEYNVCEGLDLEKVVELIERNSDFVDSVITVGVNSDSAHRVTNLNSGMDLAMNQTGEGDMIISCVKCFR
jgi:UDP-N-acetylmuramyl pentapeptide synthase